MNKTIFNKMVDYYRIYYSDMLGLSDWKYRVEKRLAEDKGAHCSPIINEIEEFIGPLAHKKILIVGCGTGGEAVYLWSKYFNNDVFGIEPFPEALRIVELKCKYYGMKNNFFSGVGEDIKFEDCTFDFVYCNAVLEHVNDYEKCLEEIIRVIKVGGSAYIGFPNYLAPMERHYKVLCYPPALPFGKLMLKLLLVIKGRPTKFVDSIRFITDKKVKKKLDKWRLKGKIVYGYMNTQFMTRGVIGIYTKIFNISLGQRILIKKVA